MDEVPGTVRAERGRSSGPGEDADLPGISEARAAGRTVLTEPEAKRLLAHIGIPIPRGRMVAAHPAAAARAAAELDVPAVVVKVVSPDLPHKSSVGAVYVGAQGPAQAELAAERVLENVRRLCPEAPVHGLLVEELLDGGIECVAGLVGQSVLGPAVMFGLGGIFVELFDDVAFRLAPLDAVEATAMLDEVRSSRLLAGYRGAPPANRAALVDILVRLGRLAVSGLVAEVDLNPLLARPMGAIALDALVRLNERPPPASVAPGSAVGIRG